MEKPYNECKTLFSVCTKMGKIKSSLSFQMYGYTNYKTKDLFYQYWDYDPIMSTLI